MVNCPSSKRSGARQKFECLGFGFELAFGDGEELAAERRQRNPARRAQEKLDAIGLLELADVIGDGRLGQRQPLGGFGKAAMLGDRVKGLELGVTHIS